jgi:hypothetical protein
LQLQQESESDGQFFPPSDNGENSEAPVDAPPDAESSLLVNTTTVGSLVLGFVLRVMFTTAAKKHPKTRDKLTCTVHIRYTVSSSITTTSFSLEDLDSNGGVSGTDVMLTSKTHLSVDIQGIDNHQVTDVSIGTVGACVETQHGPIIAIFHQ